MKAARRASLIAAVTVIAACSHDPVGTSSDPKPGGSLIVTPGIDSAFVGDTVRFAALGDSAAVTWTVSDSRVAAIEAQAGGSALIRALHLGTATVTAAETGRAASGVLVVEPGSRVAFTVQPNNATAGVVFTPAVAVTIQDTSGQPVTGATNAVTLAIGTGRGGLTGTTTVSAVNGVATFADLSIHTADAGYTLTASVSGLTPAVSARFDITPAAPSQLGFAVQPSTVQEGQPITPPVQVTIEDAFANAVTTATGSVTLAIGTNPAGGSLSGTTTATAVSGVATFANLTIDRPGTGYTLVAAATPLAGATSAAFGMRLTFASISAGEDHTCGVTPAGAAYCWGWNNLGQLGNGTSSGPQQCWGAPCSLAPVAVSGGLTFASISAGTYYTCGVTVTSAVYCWGGNSTSPVAVSGGLAFATVSAGSGHACGVTSTGAAYCWGGNANGELGNGTTTDSPIPVAVSGGLTFATVSAGVGFTCAVTMAGVAYCWGDNTFGELGNGTTTSSTTPVPVSGGLTFSAVSAGGGPHTCGVASSGLAYCWGDNSEGELGNGAGCSAPCTAPRNSMIPAAVTPAAGTYSALTLTTVDARGQHSCGITPAGAAYCWGANDLGELGAGSYAVIGLCSGCIAIPVAVVGKLAFTVVSAGWFNTCGVTNTGAGYCWGGNYHGELGYSTPTQSNPTPGAVLPP